MRTKEEVVKWFDHNSIWIGDKYEFLNFLVARGIVIHPNMIHRTSLKNEDACNMKTFIAWFENKEKVICPTCKQEIKSKQLNVGDWIRLTFDSNLYKVIVKLELTLPIVALIEDLQGNKMYLNSEEIFEFAQPKDGEFWYIECRYESQKYIFYKEGYEYITSKRYSINAEINIYGSAKYITYDSDIVDLRPATEKEKQKLIKAVEKREKKTFNGKYWIDIAPTFVKGDYVKFTNKYGDYIICIYEVEVQLFNNSKFLFCTCPTEYYINNSYNIITKCTPDECKLINDALYDLNKRFDVLTKELKDIYKPKQGEIVTCIECPKLVFAFNKKEKNRNIETYVIVNTTNKLIYLKPDYLNATFNIIPADKEQKKLFYTILAENGVTWNTKTMQIEPIINKNSIEYRFNAYIKHNYIKVTINDPILQKKIEDYNKVLLFSYFINNYVGLDKRNEHWEIRNTNGNLAIEYPVSGYISVSFDSHEKAQKAIEVLGKETIMNAIEKL